MNKKKLQILLVALLTFGLGIAAIFTSIRLYQLRSKPVAPTAPQKAPAAGLACQMSFNVPAPTLPPGVTPTPTPPISGPACPDIAGIRLIELSPCGRSINAASPRIYDLTSTLAAYNIRLAYFLGRKVLPEVQAITDGIFSLRGVPSCATEVGTFISIPASNTNFTYIEFSSKLAQIRTNFAMLEPFQNAEFGSNNKLYLCVLPKATPTPSPIPTPSCPPGETMHKKSPCTSSVTGGSVTRIYSKSIASVTPVEISKAYFLGKRVDNAVNATEFLFGLKARSQCSSEVGLPSATVPVTGIGYHYIEAGAAIGGLSSNYVAIDEFKNTQFGSDNYLYLCVRPAPTGTPAPTSTPTPGPEATPTPTNTPVPGASPTPTNTPVPGASPTPTRPWYAPTATPTPVRFAGATPTPVVELPKAGFTLPTFGFVGSGIILLILGVILAL